MAGANGRFPKAQALVTRPGSDGRELYMRATFGVMRSTDGGASWRWMCEPSLGYDGTWDPAIAVTRDGVLWVGLPDGLAYTRDGCDVTMRTTRSDHHVITQAGLASNVYGNNVLGLRILETGQDGLDGLRRIEVSVHLGRRRQNFRLLPYCCSQCLSFRDGTTKSSRHCDAHYR